VTLNDRQKVGLAILAAIGVALLIWYFFIREEGESGPEPITIVGVGGAVKAEFFENQEVIDILKNRYGITVDIETASTGDLLCTVPLDGLDFLWAGDQSQLATYEECRNRSDSYTNPVINTPLVIYSWAGITDALMEAGVVEVDGDGVYRIDMLGLVALVQNGTTWTDLGLEDRVGKVLVKTTDPNASTSGQMFAGLMASSMNCLEVVGSDTVPAVLPGIHDYFGDLGLLPDTSEQLFRLYLSQGEGANPLVALLESQIIEMAVENPDIVDQVIEEVRILYPQPTVWLTHPMIELTENGGRLADALLDPDIQALGWPKQGFRPTVPGVQIDLNALPIPGIPERIDSVVDMPADAILDQILEAATTEYVPDPNAPPLPDCASDDEAPATPVAARQAIM